MQNTGLVAPKTLSTVEVGTNVNLDPRYGWYCSAPMGECLGSKIEPKKGIDDICRERFDSYCGHIARKIELYWSFELKRIAVHSCSHEQLQNVRYISQKKVLQMKSEDV